MEEKLETDIDLYNKLEQKEITNYKDMENKIYQLGEKVFSNEESTKQGLILPYLKLLGFNYTNVNEVNPEYGIKDLGKYNEVFDNKLNSSVKLKDDDLREAVKNKKEADRLEELKVEGELGKVDYLLPIENEYHLLEAKRLGKSLLKYVNQLKSYYDNLEGSKVGILTDGNYYLYFTDIDEKGKMDRKPFLSYALINNFRNEKVEILSNLYKHTRFSETFIMNKINNVDTEFIKTYNELINQLHILKEKGLLNKKEINGLNYLLNIKLN